MKILFGDNLNQQKSQKIKLTLEDKQLQQNLIDQTQTYIKVMLIQTRRLDQKMELTRIVFIIN